MHAGGLRDPALANEGATARVTMAGATYASLVTNSRREVLSDVLSIVRPTMMAGASSAALVTNSRREVIVPFPP